MENCFTAGLTPCAVIARLARQQCPGGYPMRLVDADEWEALAEAWNQGIDSHLEAITERSSADAATGRVNVHPDELPVLCRRLWALGEEGNATAESLRSAIIASLVRALSVRQPWATLIATGHKRIELRTWSVSYRGPLLICAGVAIHKRANEALVSPGTLDTARKAPRGVSVAIVELLDVRPATRKDARHACIEPGPRDLAWVFGHARTVPALPVRGRLGLFTPPATLVERLAVTLPDAR